MLMEQPFDPPFLIEQPLHIMGGFMNQESNFVKHSEAVGGVICCEQDLWKVLESNRHENLW